MSESLIDAEAWEVMKSMTEPAFLTELIDVFLNDSPDLIQQMRAGIAAGEIDGVRRAAHSLKSNAASFGAIHLADAARELEMTVKGGSLDGAESKLQVVETEFSRLIPVLTEMKNVS
jgi:HPt (histidine-containing phosphotransfer) domain-containing protein